MVFCWIWMVFLWSPRRADWHSEPRLGCEERLGFFLCWTAHSFFFFPSSFKLWISFTSASKRNSNSRMFLSST